MYWNLVTQVCDHRWYFRFHQTFSGYNRIHTHILHTEIQQPALNIGGTDFHILFGHLWDQ